MRTQIQFFVMMCSLMTGLSWAGEAFALASQRPDGLVADNPVELARREYQITLASLARVERRLAELEADSDADPETVRTYRNYRDRLAASAEAQRRALEKRGVPVVQAGPKIADQADEAARVAPRPGPVAAPRLHDEVGRLDGELDASMSKFDGVLMRKQQELAREEPDISESSPASSAAAEAEELLEQLEKSQGGGNGAEGQDGQDGEAGGEGTEGAEESESETAGEGGEAGEEGGESADAGAEGIGDEETGEEGGGEEGSEGTEDSQGMEIGGVAMSGGQGSGEGAVGDGDPKGFPGEAEGVAGGEETEAKRGPRYKKWAADDDIVARQLRQAAEQETDPVLKEKLWKEYEAYKTGSGR